MGCKDQLSVEGLKNVSDIYTHIARIMAHSALHYAATGYLQHYHNLRPQETCVLVVTGV